MTRPIEVAAVRMGGWALVLAAILFVATFSYLAATFDYPDVLDRPAAEVLPRLVALGTTGRAVWSLYALIPLLLAPAGVGAAIALRGAAPGAARTAAAFAVISGFSMMLGLSRRPSITGSWVEPMRPHRWRNARLSTPYSRDSTRTWGISSGNSSASSLSTCSFS